MATTTRDRVQAEVHQAIEEHVPRIWRGRAQLYVPLIVSRIVSIVEELTKGGHDGE